MKKLSFYIFVLFMALVNMSIIAQESTKQTSNHSFDIGADFVSRYVWRGLLFSPSPNIQPWITYTYKNFSIGTWGSYGTNEQYAEVDLWASYTLGPVSFTLFDYYNQDETGMVQNDYFNTNRTETGHYLEGTVAYTISDDLPLTTTLATFFYGPDVDAGGDNNYSTYFELAYPFQIAGADINAFMGATLNEGYYADEAGLVNAGIKVQKSIPITEKYSLPFMSTLSLNPSSKEIFLVFGINL